MMLGETSCLASQLLRLINPLHARRRAGPVRAPARLEGWAEADPVKMDLFVRVKWSKLRW